MTRNRTAIRRCRLLCRPVVRAGRWAVASVAFLVAGAAQVGGADGSGEPASLRLVFAGDVYFGESYMGTTGEDIRPATDAHRTSVQAIRGLFGGADAVVVNLETPLTERDRSPLMGQKDMLYRGDPEETLQALRVLNVTAVGLANNHVMDYGEAGLADTLDVLRRSNVAAFGAGAGSRQAARPWAWRCQTPAGRLDVLVVAGYEYNRRYDTSYDAYAESNDEGVNLWTPTRAADQVRELRSACPDAVIVAFPHGGDNYEWRDAKQVGLHRALVGAGADLILGHGSHMAQEIECRDGCWIVNGLGNGVFNTPGRYDEVDQHPWSLVAALLVKADAGTFHLSLRLYPVLSDNLGTGYRPRPATAAEAGRVAELLNARSDRTGPAPGLQPAADDWGWHFALDLGHRDAPRNPVRAATARSLESLRRDSRSQPARPWLPTRRN